MGDACARICWILVCKCLYKKSAETCLHKSEARHDAASSAVNFEMSSRNAFIVSGSGVFELT